MCLGTTMGFALTDIPEEEARYWAKKLEQLNAMRDQDDVSRRRVRLRARAGQGAAGLQADGSHAPVSLPSTPSRRSRRSRWLFTAPSAVSAALPLPCHGNPPTLFPWLPTPGVRQSGVCACRGLLDPQAEWSSTSPHTPSLSLFPSSLPCLQVVPCCLLAPQCASPPVGQSCRGEGHGRAWQ